MIYSEREEGGKAREAREDVKRLSNGTLAGLLGESECWQGRCEYFAKEGRKELSQGYEREG